MLTVGAGLLSEGLSVCSWWVTAQVKVGRLHTSLTACQLIFKWNASLIHVQQIQLQPALNHIKLQQLVVVLRSPSVYQPGTEDGNIVSHQFWLHQSTKPWCRIWRLFHVSCGLHVTAAWYRQSLNIVQLYQQALNYSWNLLCVSSKTTYRGSSACTVKQISSANPNYGITTELSLTVDTVTRFKDEN